MRLCQNVQKTHEIEKLLGHMGRARRGCPLNLPVLKVLCRVPISLCLALSTGAAHEHPRVVQPMPALLIWIQNALLLESRTDSKCFDFTFCLLFRTVLLKTVKMSENHEK